MVGFRHGERSSKSMIAPQIPKAYEPETFTRIVKALLREIEDLRGRLTIKEAKSLDNKAIGSLIEDVPYLVVDSNRINLSLAIKHNGRLHTWNTNSSGTTGSSGGSAPADAQYVVSAADGDLPNADVLTGTAGEITVTNGTNLITLSAPNLARLTHVLKIVSYRA